MLHLFLLSGNRMVNILDNELYESILALQRELSELIGVSGNEKPVVEYIYSLIENSVDKLWVDPLGSLLAVKEGINSEERVMLDAHVDEVGFMVSHVDKKGFIRFIPIGGWDTRILLGQSVKILNNEGKQYHGIIGSKPPHLTTESERKTSLQIKDLYIDTGMSLEELLKNGINIGSVGTLYHPFVILQ